MTKEERIELFKESTALSSGHFLLTSGLHSAKYIRKRRLYLHPPKVAALCHEIAEHFKDEEIEAVVSPAAGGFVLSQWVAYYLTELTGREVYAATAEKASTIGNKKEFYFAEDCEEFVDGKRVLAVDDILTTGGSIEEVCDCVVDAGGTVIAVSVLWLRGEKGVEIGVPFFALITETLPAWTPEECPLCKQDIPFTKLKKK